MPFFYSYTNNGQKKLLTCSKLKILLLALPLGVLYISIPVKASQVDQFELSPEQLFDATVMSASKTPEKLWDTAAAVYVLNNEDIMRSGATSIPEALRMVPGVQVARINSSGWAISIRGFNNALANKLLVLIDGREVYDQLFSGVYWDVQDVPLEDIERIEVIRGPGTTLWGDNAVNGVINIITKTAAETQGGLASVTKGNQEKFATTERYGGKLGNDGFYRVYGKYFDRGDEKTLTNNNADDGWQSGRGGFRADWSKNDNDSFTVESDLYRSDASQYRTLQSFTAPFSSLISEDIDAEGGNLNGKWVHQISDDSKFTVHSYIDYTSRDQALLDDKRTTFNLDGQYEFPTYDIHKVIMGMGYRYSADNINASPVVTFLTQRDRDEVLNGFVQDKITLEPDRWFLTLGSKFEYNSYTASTGEIQPNARLQFHPNDDQMIWAAVSRAERTPSRLEQDLDAAQAIGALPSPPFAPNTLVSLDTIPNPNLSTEELIAYELGYRQQFKPNLSLDVATFYNDYNKLVTFAYPGMLLAGTDPAHTIFPFMPVNETSGDSYGAETSIEWKVLDNLKLTTSYSILQMQLKDDTTAQVVDPSATIEKESPQHQFNLRSQWDITENVSMDNMLYYVSSLPAFQIPEYWRFDTRIGWKITDKVQFSLVGQNLFDNAHREFTSASDANATQITPSIYGNITWKF